MRNIDIIATLGPASSTPEIIEKMVSEGMTIARLNFAWGTRETMDALIDALHHVEQSAQVSIPILQDLAGPRLTTADGHARNTDLPGLTQKDIDDLHYGISRGIQHVAVSYVMDATDITAVKQILAAQQIAIPVMAKIECQEAVDNFDAIHQEADAIMIARGDLGTAVPYEHVPMIERMILKRCNEKQTPVIVATEMLVSMVDHTLPTRAEANDVATAVLLGATGVMLSEETARGNHPIDAVRAMKRIVTYTQKAQSTFS